MILLPTRSFRTASSVLSLYLSPPFLSSFAVPFGTHTLAGISRCFFSLPWREIFLLKYKGTYIVHTARRNRSRALTSCRIDQWKRSVFPRLFLLPPFGTLIGAHAALRRAKPRCRSRLNDHPLAPRPPFLPGDKPVRQRRHGIQVDHASLRLAKTASVVLSVSELGFT